MVLQTFSHILTNVNLSDYVNKKLTGVLATTMFVLPPYIKLFTFNGCLDQRLSHSGVIPQYCKNVNAHLKRHCFYVM